MAEKFKRQKGNRQLTTRKPHEIGQPEMQRFSFFIFAITLAIIGGAIEERVYRKQHKG